MPVEVLAQSGLQHGLVGDPLAGAILMSGDERDRRRQTAVRDWDPGVCRRGNARRHAGDNFECDAGGGERFRLRLSVWT